MHRQSVFVLVFLASIMALFLACAPKAAPAATAAPGAQPTVAPAPARAAEPKQTSKEAWEVKWAAMVEAAKKEGKVVIYSTAAAQTRAAYQQGFKDKFGVSTEFIAAQQAEFSAKIMAERRAGLRLGDLLTGSSSLVLSTLKPSGLVEPLEVGSVLLLPEFSDPKLWVGGGMLWQDAERTCLTYSRYEMHVAARNTDLVKEGEVQSYSDLLNPKWKGKIMLSDPTKMAMNLKAVAMVGRYAMGWDWVRALAKQEPIMMSDWRLQIEWLARGKYPIAYGVKPDVLYEFQQIGSPVANIFMREGPAHVTSGAGQISMLKDAAHPNASKLFINWLFTKEGQTIFVRTSGQPSVRLDVSSEGTMFPRVAPDSKAPVGDSEEAVRQQNEDLGIIKEIFLPFLGK